MANRTMRFIVLASLFISMGVHLIVLQAAAWTRMAALFSRHDTLGISIRKTLDGQHPCSLCLKVLKASKSNASLGAFQNEANLDLFSPTDIPWLVKMPTLWNIENFFVAFPEVLHSTDSPPPKTLLA